MQGMSGKTGEGTTRPGDKQDRERSSFLAADHWTVASLSLRMLPSHSWIFLA